MIESATTLLAGLKEIDYSGLGLIIIAFVAAYVAALNHKVKRIEVVVKGVDHAVNGKLKGELTIVDQIQALYDQGFPVDEGVLPLMRSLAHDMALLVEREATEKRAAAQSEQPRNDL